ncbi:MAG: 50S ribosomal protein L4 [Chloroflexota bacterium]|nr:50S ribosomal protein L4 [Chloroflexota bacterium]
MEVPVYGLNGEVVRKIEISDSVFAVPFNEAVVHQTMLRQRANARQGTADTKKRGEVKGSGIKIYPQKHTGRSRAGDIRSPLRRKGGVTFGPHPRDYRQAMPKKMRRLAIKCLLSAKARDGELKVIEELKFEQPKTKEMVRVLTALGVDSTTIIAMPGPEENVIKSARNLGGIKTMPANLLNVVDLLSYKMLLMPETAVRQVEKLWGSEEVSNAAL